MTIPLTETIHRLHTFGYLDREAAIKLQQGDPKEVAILEEAVNNFQAFNGLKQTGELNEDTLATLHVARCSVPDMSQMEEAVCRWPDSLKDNNGIFQIRVRQNIYGLNPLNSEQEKAAWEEALAAWNAVCGINLVSYDEGHAHILAAVGALGSGTLAISYLPCGASANDTMAQTYNRAVNWYYNLLVQVFIHEIGHAIGISHGPPGSLMQPTASGNIMRPQAWDIAEAVKRYGPPKHTTPPQGDGKLIVSPSNSIKVLAQEAGTFNIAIGASSPKIIIPSSNKIEFTVTKAGEYDMLLVPRLSNVHI